MSIEMKSPSFLLYEDTAKTDLWLKLMLGGLQMLFLVLGIVLLFQNSWDALGMFGIAVFYALLFKIIMPQRYQIYSDKIRIALGGPFAWNIPLSTIKEFSPASSTSAFAYFGVRFATSSKNIVEIKRSRGCNVVISLSNKEVFLEQARQALQAANRD